MTKFFIVTFIVAAFVHGVGVGKYEWFPFSTIQTVVSPTKLYIQNILAPSSPLATCALPKIAEHFRETYTINADERHDRKGPTIFRTKCRRVFNGLPNRAEYLKDWALNADEYLRYGRT